MDVLQRVRDMRRDVHVPEEGFTRARRRLADAIRVERSRSTGRRVRRPVLLIAVASTGLAFATAGALVLPPLLGPAQPPNAEHTADPGPVVTISPGEPTTEPPAEPVTAQAVFASVAQNVLRGDTPAPASGQYLRIAMVKEELISYNSQEGVNDLVVTRSNAEMAWLVRHTQTSFAPADLHGEWVFRFPDSTQPVDYFGPGADEHAVDWLKSLTPMDGEVRSVGGPGPLGGWVDGLGGSLSDFLDRVPDEPQALRAWLDGVYADGRSNPQKAGWNLAHVLAYNVGTREERAAMYRVLSELPGAELTAQAGDRATVVFHTEPGFEPDPVAERWHSITIDTRTGIVLEYTDRGGSNPALVPDSVPDERRTFTVTVVDEIP